MWWWSSSMLVTTATSRGSSRNERSDSSASTTIHSPSPQAALVPSERSSPPIRNAGSRPQASSTWATMPQVVVLPCVPATAIAFLSDATWPSSVPRWITSRPASRAAASSGLSSGMAVETTSSAPVGHVGGVVADGGLDPRGAQAGRVGGLRAVRAGDLRPPAGHRPAPARSCPRRRCPRSAGGARTWAAGASASDYGRRRRNCWHVAGFSASSPPWCPELLLVVASRCSRCPGVAQA